MSTESRSLVLKAHFATPEPTLRPILTSLNGDGSFLISIPRPPSERQTCGRAYFHIVADPWLIGPFIAGHPWILTATLETPPVFRDGASVDGLVQEIESAAAARANFKTDDNLIGTSPPVDAILINFYGPEHMHEPSLRSFDRRIPIFAPLAQAETIRSWGFFDTVVATGQFDPGRASEWNALHPGPPMPPWLTRFFIQGHRLLNWATALIWTTGEGKEQKNEAILWSPHGITADCPAIQAFSKLRDEEDPKSRVEVLAMLHALKDGMSVGIRATLGVVGGLKLQEVTRPRYWVRADDARIAFAGFLGRLTYDIPRTLADGVHVYEEEMQKQGSENRVEDRLYKFADLDNGDCFILV